MKHFFIIALLAIAGTLTAQVDTLTGTNVTISFEYDIDTTDQGLDSFYMKWTDVTQYSTDLLPRTTTDYLFFADTNALNDYITQLQAELDAITNQATYITEQKTLRGKRLDAFKALRDSVIRGMDLSPFMLTMSDPATVQQPPKPVQQRCRLLAVFRRKKKFKTKSKRT